MDQVSGNIREGLAGTRRPALEQPAGKWRYYDASRVFWGRYFRINKIILICFGEVNVIIIVRYAPTSRDINCVGFKMPKVGTYQIFRQGVSFAAQGRTYVKG